MKENKLIFLISQPRSGSTLLQKMMTANTKVFSRSEPWIMLNPVYSLRERGVEAEYDKALEHSAVSDFLDSLPGGKSFYKEKLSSLYLELYEAYLKHSGKEFFLDKTPRYYLIIKDLLEFYPDASFIILIRNPLDVLNSILTSWVKGHWASLNDFRLDITKALDVMAEIIKSGDKKFTVVRYESLISNPESELKRICAGVSLDYQPEMAELQKSSAEKWIFGDQKIYEKSGVDKNNVDNWKENLKDPQSWRIFYDYIELIGVDKFSELGYDVAEARDYIKDNCPGDYNDVINETVSLESLIENKDLIREELASKEMFINRQNELIVEKEEMIQKQAEEIKLYDSELHLFHNSVIIKILRNIGLIK